MEISIYKQGLNERNAEPVATGSDEKWAPQISPTASGCFTWWPKVADGAAANSGKIMRSPLAGGPPEAVMDIKGHPEILFGDPTYSVGGFPSFRCRPHAPSGCVLAEKGDKHIVFTAFDPLQGRKAELTRVSVDPDAANLDFSPDGTRVAVSVFDYKAADIQIATLAGGTPQKLSSTPWTELATVAWAVDGKNLFLASASSRGTSIVRMPLTGGPKLLFKQPSWDIFSLLPSPDGHYLLLVRSSPPPAPDHRIISPQFDTTRDGSLVGGDSQVRQPASSTSANQRIRIQTWS
jgi:WD40 repeat protein